MKSSFKFYRPNISSFHKYGTYLDYMKEYLVCGDFKSLFTSMKYMFSHKLPTKDYTTKSKLGKFWIRGGTTDFQFINYAYERGVKEYMYKHGIENVRGGSYVKEKLDYIEMYNLKKEIWSATNCCFRCGRKDHFVTECFANTDIYGDKLLR